jgi:transposase
MTVPDSRRFRELSKENARLKRLLAEPDLEVDALEAWMAEATHSGIPELARFARGLQDDLTAIQAGLTLAWSNGVTEGHVHRLKLVTRQGYGRAGFALLRQRVLQAA